MLHAEKHLSLQAAAEKQDAKDDWRQHRSCVLFKNPFKESIILISPSLFQTPLHRGYPAPREDTFWNTAKNCPLNRNNLHILLTLYYKIPVKKHNPKSIQEVEIFIFSSFAYNWSSITHAATLFLFSHH